MDALTACGVEVVEADNPLRAARGRARNAPAEAAWALAGVPHRARRAGVDVIHLPLPGLARRGRVPHVVTVHDLAPLRLPHLYSPAFRRWFGVAGRLGATTAGAVVAVSETTARDVEQLWGIPRERIVVARHGPGQELDVVRATEPSHFLYVGDDEPRKDVGTLLAAHAGLELPLVLAGSASSRGTPHVFEEHAPSAARLATLLGSAAALVHPALHEGAGLTLLEAMRAGVPVVAARSAGAEETCGDAALLVAPGDPAALATALHRVEREPELRAELVARGRERATRASWENSAHAHLVAYSLARNR